MHGDHFLDVPYLRDKWGAQVWTLKDVADKCEHPERYDYAAMIPAYQAGFDALHIDRAFERGEQFEWQGYKFTVDWMPGQTEFGCCIHGMIDGKHVAFTGDNLFGSSTDPAQNGHEAVVARNSAIFEEGYIYGAEYLQKLQPDLIVAGHSYVMDQPRGDDRTIRRLGPRDSRRLSESQCRDGLPLHVRPLLGPGGALSRVLASRPAGRRDIARPQLPAAIHNRTAFRHVPHRASTFSPPCLKDRWNRNPRDISNCG